MGKKFDKFCLLMWKNWKLQYRRPLQTAVEIMAPILFSILLVTLRSLVEPIKYPTVKYISFNPINFFLFGSSPITRNYTENYTIAYSPSPNKILDDSMNKLRLLSANVISFNSSKQLEENFNSDTGRFIFAAMQFDDDLYGKDTVPSNIEVSLRFPSELRGLNLRFSDVFNSTISNKPDSDTTVVDKLRQVFRVRDWITNLLYPIFDTAGPREWTNQNGATPNYYSEGFLALQIVVTFVLGMTQMNDSFIKYMFYNIQMQRFPFSSWNEDPLLPALTTFAGMLVMLSFVYTCINTVKLITVEKEKQLKEAMKIMGLPNWLHWTAWFIKTFCFLLISITCTVFLLTVAWYPNSNFSIFTYSNPFVLFLLLVLYICASITFCFSVSSFFCKANTAATVAGLLWFLSYAPYLFLQMQYDELSLSTKLLVSLGSNTAMAYGVQIFLMFESTSEGVHWYNVWQPISPDDTLSLGLIMMMLAIDCIIYLIIALYVEAIHPGEFGTPQPWYFPFTYKYWCEKPHYIYISEDYPSSETNDEFFEQQPSDLPIEIQIKNLRKVYGKKVAVNNLSLNIYQNQITALLGHNGAGKTTTMSILTGIIPPTSGTAVIHGFDIRTNMKDIRSNLGLCPQHNILFDDLTVKEHLYFFSKLKGVPDEEIYSEICTYVELLDLVPKINTKSMNLSGGMKRKLCVGMALCGGSKIVLLDEPTAGIDPSSRRALWDLLQTQKKGRCILLTTHYMDEADLLGDRIVIMVNGDAKCCGSSFFLKKKFGSGYHLILEKSSNCNPNDVTKLLQNHIHDIQMQRNVGTELVYLLKDEHVHLFERILRDLEANLARLNIRGYGISLTTMEDVFIKVGATEAHYQTKEDIPSKDYANFRPQSKRKIVSLETISVEKSKNFVPLTGLALVQNQYIAMFMKKFLYIIRNWLLQFIQILLPVAFLIVAIIVSRNIQKSRTGNLPKLVITLDSYQNPIVLVQDSVQNNFTHIYMETLQDYTIQNVTDIVEAMLNLSQTIPVKVKKQYLVGASFVPEKNLITITAWFNNNPFHTPPLALALVLNAIYKSMLTTNHSITFANHPIPFSTKSKKLLKPGNSKGFQLAFNIGFSMAFVSSFYILFNVRERVCKSKHLQFVSGLKSYIFWTSCFICDLATFMVTAFAVLITLLCFQEDGFKKIDDFGRMLLLLFAFGFAMLPMIYFAAFLFDIPSTGYTRMTLFSVFTGVTAFLVVQILSVPDLNLQYVADGMHWFFLVIPHYALASGINSIYITHITAKMCNLFVNSCLQYAEKYTLDECWNLACMSNLSESQLFSCCDDREANYYKWKSPGIGRNLFYSAVLGSVIFLFLNINELKLFSKIRNHMYKRKNRLSPTIEDEDDDVFEEKNRIRYTPEWQLFDDYSLVLKNMTKCYQKLVAVNAICLGVKQYECFGFLGINGAGKTSTFKMITGDKSITSGNAWIKGHSARTDLKGVQENIGYCPQFDALLTDLTAKETLIMFALIRGIALRDCKFLAVRLAQDFDFYQHINKKIKHLSGGNKRKISTAISLIGDPPVICLDEPTAGMDPITKRYLWNVLCAIRDSGKCIIFTSHSMEECEALCTRLAIMVNGNFKCLGSLQHLKNKFAAGYTLTIKLKSNEDTENVENFILNKFPTAKLQEKHQQLMTFYIVDPQLSCAKMFGILETAKTKLNIEDYSLGQTNLEQIFLTLTKHQQ